MRSIDLSGLGDCPEPEPTHEPEDTDSPWPVQEPDVPRPHPKDYKDLPRLSRDALRDVIAGPIENRITLPERDEDSEQITPTESIFGKRHRRAKPWMAPEKATRAALGDVVAAPITNLAMRGASLVESGSEDAVAGQVIDQFSELLQLIADPARLPSEIAEKLAAQLATHLVVSTLGPVGPVVVMFAGKFAGELTHQYLVGGEDTSDDQDAVRAVEIAGTFADAQIGRLGDSESFRDLISHLVGSSIAAILPGDGQPPTTTAVVAVYEVRSPADDPAVVRIRPASFTVWVCVPEAAVAERWQSGSCEKLQLTDGTIIQISPDGSLGRENRPMNDGDLERRALAAAAAARAEAEAREREEKRRRKKKSGAPMRKGSARPSSGLSKG